MTTVSDIFAFACQNADYWEELLSGRKLPEDELTAEEVRAIHAAREHIAHSTEDLLRECASELGKLKPRGIQLKAKLKSGAARKNRMIWFNPTSEADKSVKHAGFWIASDSDDEATQIGKKIKLFSWVTLQKRSRPEAVDQALATAGYEINLQGDVYGSGLELTEGDNFQDVANRAALELSKMVTLIVSAK
ncbi:MAG: hypothetical protein KF696_13330 [Planctomycetes bacterium]|nr:hypothetical protein [Planctomycetota bacterium]MCW8135540.1 hypothetical protein [Planctomycetota bacterium]